MLAAGAAFALTAAAGQAQTWIGKRTTPALTEIVAVDATGEAGWIFGREDLAGDGIDTFKQPEQASDVRTAYATTDAARFWARVYVSDPSAVGGDVAVYIFIDSDADAMTGGPAAAPEIEAEFTTDPSAGGYEHALGIRGDGTIVNIWGWKAGQDVWEPLNPQPAEALAEAGKDTDPIVINGLSHGYLQGAVDLGLVGLTQACAANLFVRSANQAAAGAGDFDAGKIAPCVPADANGDDIPDLIVPVEGCTADSQCPAGGICVSGKCIVGIPCTSDADCKSTDECNPAGNCVARPGPKCDGNADCGDLVCLDGSCNPCSLGGDECDAGQRCAPTGLCVVDDGSSGSAGGVPLAPGERVQGGAFACSASPLRGHAGPAAAVLFSAGLAVARRRRRQRRGSTTDKP